MNINLVVNGKERDFALTRKLVAVQGTDILENTLYSAIEWGISGEPLANSLKDKEHGIFMESLSEITIRYDEKSASRLYNDASGWHFEETRDMPSTLGARVYTSNSQYSYKFVQSSETLTVPQLQCIRVFPEEDGYSFRSMVTNISELDTSMLSLLSVNYFSCADVLPLSFWIRLVSVFNKAIGYQVFRYDMNKGGIVAEKIDNKYSARLINNLYNLLGMCMIPLYSANKNGIKKIVLWKVVDELSYKILSVLSELPDIAFVLYTYNAEYQSLVMSDNVQILRI